MCPTVIADAKECGWLSCLDLLERESARRCQVSLVRHVLADDKDSTIGESRPLPK